MARGRNITSTRAPWKIGEQVKDCAREKRETFCHRRTRATSNAIFANFDKAINVQHVRIGFASTETAGQRVRGTDAATRRRLCIDLGMQRRSQVDSVHCVTNSGFKDSSKFKSEDETILPTKEKYDTSNYLECREVTV